MVSIYELVEYKTVHTGPTKIRMVVWINVIQLLYKDLNKIITICEVKPRYTVAEQFTILGKQMVISNMAKKKKITNLLYNKFCCFPVDIHSYIIITYIRQDARTHCFWPVGIYYDYISHCLITSLLIIE